MDLKEDLDVKSKKVNVDGKNSVNHLFDANGKRVKPFSNFLDSRHYIQNDIRKLEQALVNRTRLA